MTNNAPDYNNNLYFEPQTPAEDLTKQLVKGELPAGWYYVRYKSGKIEPAEYQEWINEKTESWYHDFDSTDDIEAVIAPVPSFEEFDMLTESEMNSHLQADNYYNQLSELREQIEHANRLIQWVRHSSWSCNQEEDDFDRYVKKWGVK